ncbi:MAG: hypothetical protein V3U56_04175 [Syntrophobacteria bacterium]
MEEKEWLEKMKEREEQMALVDELLGSGVDLETIKAELEKAIEEATGEDQKETPTDRASDQ